MDFNDNVYLFFDVVSDDDDEHKLDYLKLTSHYFDVEETYYFSINSEEAEEIHSIILRFRARMLGLKGCDSNDKK